jgi:hypothetical protein
VFQKATRLVRVPKGYNTLLILFWVDFGRQIVQTRKFLQSMIATFTIKILFATRSTFNLSNNTAILIVSFGLLCSKLALAAHSKIAIVHPLSHALEPLEFANPLITSQFTVTGD